MRDDILTVLKEQAWERAKGELGAMLASGMLPQSCRGYEDMKAHDARAQEFADVVAAFIAEVEGEYM